MYAADTAGFRISLRQGRQLGDPGVSGGSLAGGGNRMSYDARRSILGTMHIWLKCDMHVLRIERIAEM